MYHWSVFQLSSGKSPLPGNGYIDSLSGTERKGIHIGKNCWIGAKVTILDGVQIGANSIIAAGAVVTKSMPDNAVIGGVPAKVIRLRNQDSKEVTLPGQMFA
ncbi:MAG: hypothetical protein IPP46_04855 [Bacteroidetes bacterium]|nr:hypothetical protein [Bacteroidota bacterium]